MARSDKFIEKLNSFTDALQDLVDLMGEESKSNPTESADKLASSFDGEQLNAIAKDIAEIKGNVSDTKSDTTEILKAVKAQKEKENKGAFSDAGDKNNQNTILNGVKTVILIAAGVLAIGLAFKIVGDVDFLSVVALGMGIMFAAYAFAQVASIQDSKGKPIDLKRAIKVSAIMLIIATSLMLSGFILKMMPVIGFAELFTVVGVGVSLGLAAFFILKGFGKLKPRDLLTLALVPFLLPVIALAIVASSLILTLVVDVPMWTVIKAAISIGLATLAMLPLIMGLQKAKLLNPSSIKDLAIGIVAIVLISAAIALSSWVITLGNYDGNYPTWEWSLGVGIAVLAFSVPMLGVGAIIAASGGLGLLAIAAGLLAIPMIALAIVTADYILSQGDYTKKVPFWWAVGTSLLMVTYSALMVSLGLLFPLVLLGVPSILLVAWSITKVSEILANGTYEGGPGLGWAAGVSLAILAFGTEMVALGVVAITGFGLGFAAIVAGGVAMLVVAEAIQLSSHILSKGNYSEGAYPSLEWAGGVGGSIMAFAKALAMQQGMSMMSNFMGGGDVDLSAFIIKVSNAILLAGILFSASGEAGMWLKGSYPGEDWALGVGGAVTAFANALDVQQSSGGWFGDNVDFSAFIISVSGAIMTAGRMFSGKIGEGEGGTGLWEEGSYPGEDWAKGVGGTIDSFARALQAQSDASGFWSGEFDFAGFILKITATILMAGNMFTYGYVDAAGYYHRGGSGLWEEGTYPGESWASGIGNTIDVFTKALADIDGLDGNILSFIVSASLAILRTGYIFSTSLPEYWDESLIPEVSWAKKIVSVLEIISNSEIILERIHVFYWSVRSVHAAATWLGALAKYTWDHMDDVNEALMKAFILARVITIIELDLIKVKIFKWSVYDLVKAGIRLSAFSNFNYEGIDRVIPGLMKTLAVITIIRDTEFDTAKTDSFYDNTETLVDIAELLDEMNDFNFGGVIIFTAVVDNLFKVLPKSEEVEPFERLVRAMQELGDISWSDMLMIRNVGWAVEDIAGALSSLDSDNMNSFLKMGAGFQLMSLVDHTELLNVLDVLDEKTSVLQNVTDDGGSFITDMLDSFFGVSEKDNKEHQATKDAKKEGGGAVVNQFSPYENRMIEAVEFIAENTDKMVNTNIKNEERVLEKETEEKSEDITTE